MNQITSQAEREKRAREIYRSAFWSAFFVGFAILIALEIALLLVQSGLKMHHTNIIGGFPVLIIVGSHLWAFRSLRRAGLLHEKREIVGRAGAVAAGEAIEFHYPRSVWGKLGIMAALIAFGVAGWWLWGQGEQFFGALGILLSFGLIVLSVFTFHLPNVRLDDRGVFGYIIGSELWPRLVRWDEIGSVQFNQISGLPAPPFKKDWVCETIILKNAAGKTLMTLGTNAFAGTTPELKQRFIAELKRRMRAATSPELEKSNDE